MEPDLDIDDPNYRTYCLICMTAKPWKHAPDPYWLIFLRKVRAFFKGEWTLEFRW
jgi:hypothetical protein